VVKLCECCGHPLPPLEVAEYLTKQQTLILIALDKAGKAGLTLPQMVEALHAHDPNGGPDFAEQSLRVQFSKMGPVLKSFGLRIATLKNSVRRLDKYD
jgi:hypothetical protein